MVWSFVDVVGGGHRRDIWEGIGGSNFRQYLGAAVHDISTAHEQACETLSLLDIDSFLLDRLLQYENVEDSSSDSDMTASSDSEADGPKEATPGKR